LETQLDLRGMSKPEAYGTLKTQLDAVCEGVTDPITVMSTMACLLYYGFGHLWTGFYRQVDATRLMVGPYQGTLGCLEILLGRGVCGTAASTRRTVIVPDVSAFSGHIACDARSRSEIVVPVFDHQGRLTAVLDIDSTEIGTFDAEDQRQLELWVAWFAQPALGGAFRP
jgi:L-methionine (R)-S-oxide reductase